MQEELLTFEREFTQAVAGNDVAAIGRFVADDWVIVDADGWPLAGGTPNAGPSTIIAECRLADALDNAISPNNNVHADRRPELYGRLAQTSYPESAI